jgi:hypothetical protein
MTVFLELLEPRDLIGTYPTGLRPEALFLGRGDGPLELAQFSSARAPTRPQLRELHQLRQGRRATPVLIVVLHGTERAALAMRFGDDWTVHEDLDAAQVERLSAAALDAPDRHAADALLRQKLVQLAEQPIPGLRNAGLFALHELEHGVPARADWAAACTAGQTVLSLRGRDLVQRLGFTIETLPGPASVLRARETRAAIAVFLERADEIEPANERYDGLSPVSYALAKADAEKLDYVIVAAGTLLRVYPVPPGVGTARRGRTETFVELDVALLDAAAAGYLPLLASADALTAGGAFAQVLEASKRFASDLGARLRDRVYADVMPALCAAFVHARRLRHPSRETLAETFEMALLTLFRLLFVAYAEDKELLPYHTNATYRDKALKTLAQRLQREQDEHATYGSTTAYWDDVRQIWQAVDKGNHSWGVPAYNGGLFAAGDNATKWAQLVAQVSLPDSAFAPALRALLLDVTAEGTVGPVDFRALGVREFGTVYEGLLEQELSVAEQDLGVNAQGAYIPAATGATPRGRGRARVAATEVVVPAGQVYLHDKSGARKASGAYYTKDFAVEHLLERALEPALVDHRARLDALNDDGEAADRFFDFHVADIAMGSGHFLVAAVDHIERGLAGYLAKRPLAGVRNELARLRKIAEDSLGDAWRGEPIEDTQLLRRQIARRCVHGVDLNPSAVELSRLSLWIHTFVPGLPLSFLDATLVCGNALVGIATFEEARELSGAEAGDLFAFTAEDMIAKAREPLSRLARLSEATAAEVKDARKYYGQAKTAIAPTNDLFTVLAASRVDVDVRAAVAGRQVSAGLRRGDLFADRLIRKSEKALTGLRPLHFPTTFPQVFDRSRAGFDVIVGNPPWEKARVEEHEFWARHAPGLRALPTDGRAAAIARLQRERPDLCDILLEEKAIAERFRDAVRHVPGMNTGHPDLFRAFLGRYQQLIAPEGGQVGVVLPGDTFKIRGAESVRRQLVSKFRAVEVLFASNKGEWLFAGVDERKLIAFVALRAGDERSPLTFLVWPDTRSVGQFAALRSCAPVRLSTEFIDSYSTGLVMPVARQVADFTIIEKMLNQRSLANHPDFPVVRVYADFETTRDKDRWHADRRYGDWPVYKGESFNLWVPDTGTYFGFTQGSSIQSAIYERRLRSPEGSPYSRLPDLSRADRRTLSQFRPRIAFRDVSNRTNQRTLIVALIPPKVVTTQTAPWLLWHDGYADATREAQLLAFMSSLVADWWMRRFVEGHVDQEAFNSLRVPRVTVGDRRLHARLVSLSARLSVQADERFEEWGAALDVAPSILPPAERDDHIAEVDAIVALLYDLSEHDLTHVFETFHEGWDCSARLDATRRHFRRLSKHA